jgi:hypothetical protein
MEAYLHLPVTYSLPLLKRKEGKKWAFSFWAYITPIPMSLFKYSKKQKKSRMTQKLGLRLFAVAENFLTLLNRTTDRTNC